jgi:hypothetical protein
MAAANTCVSGATLPYLVFLDTATIGPASNDYTNYELTESGNTCYATSNGQYNAPYLFSTGA